jgi:hypothetical protein
MVRFKRLNCSPGHSSRTLLLPGRRARGTAGYLDGARLTSWLEKLVIMGVLADRSYVVPICARKALRGVEFTNTQPEITVDRCGAAQVPRIVAGRTDEEVWVRSPVCSGGTAAPSGSAKSGRFRPVRRCYLLALVAR